MSTEFNRPNLVENKATHPLYWITEQELNLENLRRGYIKKASESLPSLFNDFVSKESRLDPFVAKIFEDYLRMLSGGRKIRGLLAAVSFSISDGEPHFREEIIRSSLAYEMIHNAFLIHDDIEDNSPTRRDQDTLHVAYQKLADKLGYQDTQNLGKALALNAGDKGPAIAFLIILRSNLPDDRKLASITHLSEVISDTVSGQAIDLSHMSLDQLTRRKVYQIDVFKTAKYTFAGPLKLGSILAGASEREQQLYVKFGLPLGIAFQIYDDIAGVFGNPEELGKPTDSDLKEAKKTLLFWYAFNTGSRQQRTILQHSWGNQSLTEENLNQVREILLSTGSVDYSFNVAKALVYQAKKFIPKITDNAETRQVLEQIADFSITNYVSIKNLSHSTANHFG